MSKNLYLSEIISIEKIENKLIIRMKKPDGFDYEAGQYASIKIEDLPTDHSRTFSFASSPSEPDIIIGSLVSDPPSTFKAAMMSLRPGDPITIKGPNGDFVWRDSPLPSVLIALGVGITPMRSLLLAQDYLANKTLIYAGSSYKLFLDEFRKLKAKGLKLIEISHRHELDEALKSVDQLESSEFYVCGSVDAVEGAVDKITALNVSRNQIYTDIFFGY
jgi:ferredoxin-NADP reductase